VKFPNESMTTAAAFCIKKSYRARSCNFATESGKFLTEQIMGIQTFNCVPKLPQIGD